MIIKVVIDLFSLWRDVENTSFMYSHSSSFDDFANHFKPTLSLIRCTVKTFSCLWTEIRNQKRNMTRIRRHQMLMLRARLPSPSMLYLNRVIYTDIGCCGLRCTCTATTHMCRAEWQTHALAYCMVRRCHILSLSNSKPSIVRVSWHGSVSSDGCTTDCSSVYTLSQCIFSAVGITVFLASCINALASTYYGLISFEVMKW